MFIEESEKEIMQKLATLIDKLYSNGAHSMYGHNLNEAIVDCFLNLSSKRKIKVNMPSYDEDMENYLNPKGE